MSAYTYKRDYNFPVEAEAGKIELERIRDKYQGLLKPEYVVDESRSKNAALHGIFEWNDPVAAEKYRHIQAGNYMRSIVVVMENTQIRAYHNVTIQTESSTERGYLPIEVVKKDQKLWSQVMDQAMKDLVNIKNKYRNLNELNSVFEEIEKLEFQRS
jgi:hypothetical protein